MKKNKLKYKMGGKVGFEDVAGLASAFVNPISAIACLCFISSPFNSTSTSSFIHSERFNSTISQNVDFDTSYQFISSNCSITLG